MQFDIKGVFPEVLNRHAFFDKVVVSVWGEKKEVSGPHVRDAVNHAIGGEGRNYARKEGGVLASSGNSYDLVYGPMRLIGILPPMSLTIRSDGAPTTETMIREGIDAVCEECSRTSISEVELTFDFTGHPIDFFRRSIFSSAHRFASLRDQHGRETHYFGGVTSPLEVCVYQKTNQVVRLEFILRRPFLRKHGITKVGELEKLRRLNLKQWLQLREVNEIGVKALEERVRRQEDDDVRRRILVKWIRDLPLRESVSALKKHFGGVADELTKPSPVDEQLRQMQLRLVA